MRMREQMEDRIGCAVSGRFCSWRDVNVGEESVVN